MACLYMLNFPVRGLRWWLSLKPVKPVSWFSTTSIVVVARAANNLLPARLGELVRSYLISCRGQINGATAITSVGIERMFDGIALISLFLLCNALLPFHAAFTVVTAKISTLITVFAILTTLMIAAARSCPDKVLTIASLLQDRLGGKLGETLYTFTKNFIVLLAHSFSFDRRMVAILALSVLAWLLECFMFLAALKAFGLPPDPVLAFYTTALVNLGIVLPSLPGDIGLFHAAVVVAFKTFGLSPDLALGYALLVHCIQYLPATLVGLALLGRERESLASLARLVRVKLFFTAPASSE